MHMLEEGRLFEQSSHLEYGGKMRKYVIKRVGISIIILFFVSITVFTLIQLQPGNPFVGMVRSDMDPQFIEKQMNKYGYNDPLPEQYFKWIIRTIKGDLGYSLQHKTSVMEMIQGRMKNTLLLSGTAFLLSSLFSCVIGVYVAYKYNSVSDKIITIVSFIFISVPLFFIALILIKIFSFDLMLLPPSGIETVGKDYEGILRCEDIIKHMILPVGILTAGQTSALIRYIRSSMIDVFNQDYMRMAKAKGISRNRIIWVHGFKNILASVITILVMQLPGLLSGAVLLESIFSWPGIGKLNYDAILTQDYPVIMGVTIILSVIIVGMNLFADILCAFVNPKIKIS